MKGAVVIGVGNPFRRDDGVGAAVVERLRGVVGTGVVVAERDGEPTGLLDAWAGVTLAVVVDAVASHGEPGRLHRFEVCGGIGSVPDRAYRGSSHALGIGDAVDLGRALDRLPERLVVLGVEAADLGDGLGLSAPVAAALDGVVARVLAELAERA